MKNVHSYGSLSQAISDLQTRGYDQDLNFCESGLENRRKSCIYLAGDLEVREYYRFEGASDPGDNSILYAIETNDGLKGILVDAYGAYSGNIPREIIEKLRIDR